VPKKKGHFPQIPLNELKKILRGDSSISRRPRNVSVERRKGNEPYSLPLPPEEYGGEWQRKAICEAHGIGARSFGEI